MTSARLLGLIALLGLALQQTSGSAQLNNWTLPDFETRLSEIDAELKQLPALAMRSDSGAIGYRSESHTEPNKTEWIQIDLEHQQPIDEIVLVPTIRRDPQDGFQADAFPLSFKIVVGTQDDHRGQVIASYTEDDQLLPRAAPLSIPCQDLRASWVRIEATQLGIRAWDNVYVLQLAEVMLFSSGRNLALGRKVSASSSSPGPEFKYAAHSQRYLVDGFLPYSMDDYKGTQSIPYLCLFPLDVKPVLTIDLEQSQPIHQINIHGIELSDSIPQSNPDDFGMPKQLRIEAANTANFSDATVLVDYQTNSIYDSGPIILHKVTEGAYRYLKFTVLKPDITDHMGGTSLGILGLAEIEVFSGSVNVAQGKAISIETQLTESANNLEALTDGRNYYGDILPFDQWMRQLARRHELEVERPKVLDAISQGYARQRANLRLMVYLASALAVGIIMMFLIGRMREMRQIARIRKRFAADLHDELGANLHAIGLLSDLAHDAVDEKDKLLRIVKEMRTVTERTSDAVRYCANSQEARDPMGTLRQDMHRIAKRMMHDMDYTIQIKGETFLQTLKLRTRNDLFLFYKECLANISRHSGATAFSIELLATSQQIRLCIEDNGQGYTATADSDMPPSLKRRAQIMHGQIHLTHPAEGGTRICLHLKRRKFFFLSH